MSKYKDVMLDIETLGNRPYSIILSIGAVEFDPRTGNMGNEFYVLIDHVSSRIET
jgi:DNA polymerase III epsilon subunit-like protein